MTPLWTFGTTPPIRPTQIIYLSKFNSKKGIKVSIHGQIDFLSVDFYKATRAKNLKNLRK